MRYRCVTMLLVVFTLTACTFHEKYMSEKALAEIPARMESLTPEMTSAQILQTLGVPDYYGAAGGGSTSAYWNLYNLRPKYRLTIVTNVQKKEILEVDFQSPTQNINKVLHK